MKTADLGPTLYTCAKYNKEMAVGKRKTGGSSDLLLPHSLTGNNRVMRQLSYFDLRSGSIADTATMLATQPQATGGLPVVMNSLRVHKCASIAAYPGSSSAPLQNFNTQHLLCLQLPVTMMFPPMRRPPSSPQTEVRRNRLPLFRGLKSGFCSFSSSQNRSHPRSYTLSHPRSVTSCPTH